VSLRALCPAGNYAYVKFDTLFNIFDESLNFKTVSAPPPVVVSSLVPSTVEVRPPLLDPHVLHTHLELRNLCVTRFESSWAHALCM
jgi:hypothetical protein